MENSVLTRVLLIGEDEGITDTLRQILELNAFEVFATGAGLDSLQTIHQSNPEIVVLDLLAPDTNSWQICNSIRSFSKVPILVLSPVSTPGVIARALDAGADDLLLKPAASSMLIAHLKRLARRARAERAAGNPS